MKKRFCEFRVFGADVNASFDTSNTPHPQFTSNILILPTHSPSQSHSFHYLTCHSPCRKSHPKATNSQKFLPKNLCCTSHELVAEILHFGGIHIKRLGKKAQSANANSNPPTAHQRQCQCTRPSFPQWLSWLGWLKPSDCSETIVAHRIPIRVEAGK